MVKEDNTKKYCELLSRYGNSVSVIYAEDDDDIRDSFHKMLNRFFPDIRVAKNGAEALEHFNQRAADLIITDMVMPKMDALELCTRVKELNSEQKIMVISGHGDQQRLIDLINIGVDKFVQKPVENQIFLQKLSIIATGVYEHKQVDELHRKLEEKLKSIQNIIDIMSDGIVVIEGNKISQVNSKFLSLSNTKSLASFLVLHNNIPSIFSTAKDYLSSKLTNSELIALCSNNEVVKGIVKQDSGLKIVQIKLSKLNETASILTFSDITHIEKELVHTKYRLFNNPITNIFNKTALVKKIQDIENSAGITFVVYSFSNYNSIRKQHGKDAALTAEVYFTDSTKEIIEKNFKRSNVYFANYDKNAFILICKTTDAHSICTMLYQKEIAIPVVNPKTNQDQVVRFNSVVRSFELQNDMDCESVLARIDKELNEMSAPMDVM